MPPDSFFEWLTTTPWAKFMNGPEWAFPLVESLHFIGLALSIGMRSSGGTVLASGESEVFRRISGEAFPGIRAGWHMA